jgi:hypothetical protein
MANLLTDSPQSGGWNTQAAGNLAEAQARRGPVNTMAPLAEGIASGAAAAAQGMMHRHALELQMAQLQLEGSKITAANRALLDHPYELQFNQNMELMKSYADKGGEVPDWLRSQNEWLAGYLRHDGSVDQTSFPATGKLPGVQQPREVSAELGFMERGGQISDRPIQNAGDSVDNGLAEGQVKLGDKYYLMPPDMIGKTGKANEAPKVHSVEIGENGQLYSVSNVPGAPAQTVLDESGKPIKVGGKQDSITLQGERYGAVRDASGKVTGYAKTPTMRPVSEIWTATPGNLVPWYKGGSHGSLPALTMDDFGKGNVDSATMARAKELYQSNPMAQESQILSILNTERNASGK